MEVHYIATAKVEAAKAPKLQTTSVISSALKALQSLGAYLAEFAKDFARDSSTDGLANQQHDETREDLTPCVFNGTNDPLNLPNHS